MKIDKVIIKVCALCILLSFLLKCYCLYHPLSALDFYEEQMIKFGFKLFSVKDSKELLTHDIYINERKCMYLDPNGYSLIWNNRFQYNSSLKLQQFTVESNRNGPENPTNKLFGQIFYISQSKYKTSDTTSRTFPYIANLSAVSPSNSDIARNLSQITPVFNFPIDESKPGKYFWWLNPEQIHISWTENPGEIRLTWVTFIAITQKLFYRRIACSNTSIPEDWASLEVSTSIFHTGKEALRYQYIHTAVIKAMVSSCDYEYIVGETCLWSDAYVIKGRTPYEIPSSAENDVKKPVKMVVLGDWGTGILGSYTKELLEKEIKLHELDGIIHAGDIGYDLDAKEGAIGDAWLNLVQPIAAVIPYMTLPGNHESGQNFTHYKNRFKMPVNSANQGTNMFYSFNLGLAHFILFSTEQYFFDFQSDTIESSMKWLIADLKQANDSRIEVPWIFFFTHRVLYCSAVTNSCFKHADKLRNIFEELFNEYSVDVVFQAHIHNYERYRVMYKNQSYTGPSDSFHYYFNPKHPIYIVNGNAGNFWAHNSPIRKDTPEHLITFSEDYGYGRLIVFNNTCMYYEQFSSEASSVIDYFYLVKTRD